MLLLIDSIGQIVDLISGCQSALTICKTVPLLVKAIFIRPGDLIVWFYDCDNKFAGFLIRVIFQKISRDFRSFFRNVYCGCAVELPLWGNSTEHPQYILYAIRRMNPQINHLFVVFIMSPDGHWTQGVINWLVLSLHLALLV